MFLIIASTLVVTLYFGLKLLRNFINGNNDYWLKQSVPLALVSEFGSYYEIITGKKKLQDLDLYYYNKYPDAPYIGVMELRSPVFFVRDMELTKKVMIKDFEHFTDRRIFPVGKDPDLTNKIIGNVHGQKWKDTRAAFTPAFTTGKIRRMFDHFGKSSLNLMKFIKTRNELANSNATNLREVFGRYTMDIVASTAFGMDSRSFTDDKSIFLSMGQRFLNYNIIRTIKMILVTFTPKLGQFFGLSVVDNESLNFFKSVASETIKKRRANKTENQYNDFLSVMMETSIGPENSASESSVINNNNNSDSKITSPKSESTAKITDEHIVANSMLFFLAGFDATESLLTVATYQMAIHPEMQEKARTEVQEVIKEFDGKITFDSLNKMNYLEMLMSEVTRLHPPAPRTERVVSKDYQVPDSDIILKKGTLVAIPIIAFHWDEKYFPEPEKFDPERFSPENKASRPSLAYMPFGHGPRNCIGLRYSLTATKAALAHLVHHFEISPCSETFIPIRMEDTTGFLKPAKGLKVALKPRFDF